MECFGFVEVLGSQVATRCKDCKLVEYCKEHYDHFFDGTDYVIVIIEEVDYFQQVYPAEYAWWLDIGDGPIAILRETE